MGNKTQRLAVAAGFTAYTMRGFSFLAATRCQELASPMVLLMYRFDIAAIVLLIPVLLGIKKYHSRGKLGLVLLIGLLDPIFNRCVHR